MIGRGKTDVCYILRRFDERMECRKMMRHIYFTTVQFLKKILHLIYYISIVY